jgi:hypothetical protein
LTHRRTAVRETQLIHQRPLEAVPVANQPPTCHAPKSHQRQHPIDHRQRAISPNIQSTKPMLVDGWEDLNGSLPTDVEEILATACHAAWANNSKPALWAHATVSHGQHAPRMRFVHLCEPQQEPDEDQVKVCPHHKRPSKKGEVAGEHVLHWVGVLARKRASTNIPFSSEVATCVCV